MSRISNHALRHPANYLNVLHYDFVKVHLNFTSTLFPRSLEIFQLIPYEQMTVCHWARAVRNESLFTIVNNGSNFT